MKLKDQKEKGTYAGLRPTKETLVQLTRYCIDNNIPRPNFGKFHVTLLHSRKHLPDYQPAGNLEEPYVCTPQNFDVWKTSVTNPGGPQTNCLVVKLDCPEILARHTFLMAHHGATYDYDYFRPHLTLAYDVGDLDPFSLPSLGFMINLGMEFRKDLDLNILNKYLITTVSEESKQLARKIVQTYQPPENIQEWAKQLANDVKDAND